MGGLLKGEGGGLLATLLSRSPRRKKLPTYMRQYLLPQSDGGTTGERESAEKGKGKERETEYLWRFDTL